MRRIAWPHLALSLWMVAAGPALGWDDESPTLPPPFVARPDSTSGSTTLDSLNRDGTPLIEQATHQEPTDAQKLVTPNATVLNQSECGSCSSSTRVLSLTPGLCVDYLRMCCGWNTFEPFAPLPSSGASHVESALVGNRLIQRYDLGWSMTHPDRAEYYMARSRAIPGVLGAGGLRKPETSVDAQELSTYLETAFCQRFSVFMELPERFLNPDQNRDYYGFGDFSAGLKFTYCVEENSLQTFYLRVYTPTGDSLRGLGTGHSTIEPGLLVFERLTPGLVLELEVKDWIPIEGDISAGNIIRYGAALTCDLCTLPSGHYFRPVFEMVGWTVLRGSETAVYPHGDPVTFSVVENPNRSTIINADFGFRCGGDKGDIYLGYERALTGPRWFQNGARLELRLFF